MWRVGGVAFRSLPVAQLVEAVAHEAYRQISNRHSANQPFTPKDLIQLLGAYQQLRVMDGERRCRGGAPPRGVGARVLAQGGFRRARALPRCLDVAWKRGAAGRLW